MTNAQFEALSLEEVKKYFSEISEEEALTLTKDQKVAYEKYKNGTLGHTDESVLKPGTPGKPNKKGEIEYPKPHDNPKTARQFADNFFAGNPQYTGKSVFVSEDGTIFPEGVKGQNHAANYGKPFEEVSK